MAARTRPAPKPAEEDTGEKYFARRPIKLSGFSYAPGDRIPASAIDSLPRPESLIRAGLVTRG